MRSVEYRRYVVNHHPQLHGSDVILDRLTRSSVPPAFRIPAGTVIVRLQSGQTFVDASDPRGGRCLPAEIRALQPADAAWANTLISAGLARGLGFAVQLDPAATTTGAVVDQLNRHVPFGLHFLADDVQGVVRIRTRETGGHVHMFAESSLPAAFGPSGSAAHGLDADYRVSDETVEVRDLDGNPIEALVSTLVMGHFDESELLNLTPEARAVLSRRGALFA